MSDKREDVDDFEVWYKYNIEGWTYREISDYYNIDQATIYYRLHPDKRKEHNEKCKESNNISARKYAKTNKGKVVQKRFFQSDKGKLLSRKYSSKQRELGFISLNEPFGDSDFHHYNKDYGFYIPTEIHKSIWHSVRTGKNMEAINKEAFEFLEWEMREKQWEELED